MEAPSQSSVGRKHPRERFSVHRHAHLKKVSLSASFPWNILISYILSATYILNVGALSDLQKNPKYNTGKIFP